MKYARIIDNKVIETFVTPEGVDITECFTEELVAQFIKVSDDIEQNWTFENGIFSAPVVSADQTIITQE
jgi:hypothetical protein